MADSFLIIHFRPRASEPFGVAVIFDGLRQRLGFAAVNAGAFEALFDSLLDDLTGRTELRPDYLRLAHQRLENDVGLALLVAEITAEHLFCRLKLAVDAAITLFES